MLSTTTAWLIGAVHLGRSSPVAMYLRMAVPRLRSAQCCRIGGRAQPWGMSLGRLAARVALLGRVDRFLGRRLHHDLHADGLLARLDLRAPVLRAPFLRI